MEVVATFHLHTVEMHTTNVYLLTTPNLGASLLKMALSGATVSLVRNVIVQLQWMAVGANGSTLGNVQKHVGVEKR